CEKYDVDDVYDGVKMVFPGYEHKIFRNYMKLLSDLEKKGDLQTLGDFEKMYMDPAKYPDISRKVKEAIHMLNPKSRNPVDFNQPFVRLQQKLVQTDLDKEFYRGLLMLSCEPHRN